MAASVRTLRRQAPLPEIFTPPVELFPIPRTYKMSGIVAFGQPTSRSGLDQGRVGEDAKTTRSSAEGFTPPVKLKHLAPDI